MRGRGNIEHLRLFGFAEGSDAQDFEIRWKSHSGDFTSNIACGASAVAE